MIPKKYEIGDSERKKILENITSTLKNEKNVVFGYLHGSFLNNFFRDVDLAIYIQDKLTKKEALKEELKLERELEDKIKLPCDVRILNYSPLSFRYKVFRDGKLLLTKNEFMRSDFESISIRKYHDLNFHRKRYMREALGIEV